MFLVVSSTFIKMGIFACRAALLLTIVLYQSPTQFNPQCKVSTPNLLDHVQKRTLGVSFAAPFQWLNASNIVHFTM